MNSQHFSTPEPTPRGNTSAQDLHLELVRHYADVLRMLTARVPALGPPATPAAAPPLAQEAPEAQLEETPASWEEASGYLHARDFRREEVVHLWLQLCYVLGTHVLVGLAVTIQGYRRIAGVIESTPQDQERMEGFLYDLDARGLSADRGLLCTVPGGIALPNAVRTVWGSRVALQRCLNITMAEVVNGLGGVDAGRFRHRLQHAWHTCDAAEAQQALEEIARDLDQKNRYTRARVAATYGSNLNPATNRYAAPDRPGTARIELSEYADVTGSSRDSCRSGPATCPTPVCWIAGA